MALILVLANVALLFLLWSLANRQCSALLSLEVALDRRARRHQGSLAALARGLALLETGVPPETSLEGDPSTYRCIVEINPPASTAPLLYTLTFQLLDEEAGQWSVLAAPWDPEADADLEPPVSFE